jgi:hypothetical protein
MTAIFYLVPIVKNSMKNIRCNVFYESTSVGNKMYFTKQTI